MVRPKKYEEGTTTPNDVLKCDTCEGTYTRAHRSQHMKTKKHKESIKSKLKNKEEKEEIDIEENIDTKYIMDKKKKIVIGTIGGDLITIEDKNDDYFFSFRGELHKKIKTKSSEIKPLPQNQNPRAIVYVCGKSNSGKSTYCREYIDDYLDVWPDREVYIVIKDDIDKGKAFSGLDKNKNVFFVKLDLFSEEIKMEEFPDGSLILLDDIDYISDKAVKTNIHKLKDEILGAGSKRKISLLLTSHLINKGHSTREIINELNQVVLFPQGCLNMNYFLEHYLGFKKSDIEKVHSLKTRYILINNGVPQYLLSKHELYMLGSSAK